MKFVQATFGNSNRPYTFKLDSPLELKVGNRYNIIADETKYNSPVKIKSISSTRPRNLSEDIYLKTIVEAESLDKSEDIKEETHEEVLFI